MNLAIIIGRLGRDPEKRVTTGGQDVCSLRIATDFKGKGSETKTDWHDVVVWGQSAQACAEHLKCGRLVAVQGRLHTRSWENGQGEKKWRTEIVAHRVDFLAGGDVRSRDRESSPLPF